MASIFTYDPDPPRVSSPWSASGSSTPQPAAVGTRGVVIRSRTGSSLDHADPDYLSDYGITKLEPEPQEGPTEYKLHLLLRPRRLFSSMSTGHLVGGSYHSRSSFPTISSLQVASGVSPKLPQTPSNQGRQQRLQQLTTQLLWRLQQSSPFHSSSTANLVLPVLPEATPKLGVPPKPTRLLPGLEESQGALYEIGVADDGTFVGLTEDELDESLSNLQAMAASLGCKVDILRKVVVGNCEWSEDLRLEDPGPPKTHTENLWVAEALVSPDLEFYRSSVTKGLSANKKGLGDLPADATKEAAAEDDRSRTEQIRISITGPSGAGKSSLLGTLTTSALDNGRGKSRLSLLKHRHEISSGVTSSVAQELIGYGPSTPGSGAAIDVINYASGNTTAWNDIHVAAEGGRLAFVSDLPGLTRYVKSTVRGLVSWAPHYVFLCVPANCCEELTPESSPGSPEQAPEIDVCLSYLELCVKLEVPILLAITKLDLASRSGLRHTLAKVLSALKIAGKKPHMLSVATAAEKTLNLQRITPLDSEEAWKAIAAADRNWSQTVPIILTSAVDGSGIGKLHALLRHLPIPRRPHSRTVRLPNAASMHGTPENLFDIDEVFAIPPSKVYSATAENTQRENQGVVLCGLVRYGSISVGDELLVGPLSVDSRADDGSPRALHRNRSFHNSENHSHSLPQSSSFGRRISGDFSTSYVQGLLSGKSQLQVHGEWQRVRVVSVRNLRFPVRTLLEDQVGTIGVEPIPSMSSGDPLHLGRLRKGMILAGVHSSSQNEDSPSIRTPLSFHVGFIATFPSSDFSSALSPPLILGGTAKIYTSNVRGTAKVTCVALAENDMISAPSSPTEPDFFSFDGDDGDRTPNHGPQHRIGAEVHKALNASDPSNHEGIKITFSFVSSIEWLEIGSRVLVMPGTATAVSVAEQPVHLTGLEGFVGRICEVLNGENVRES